MFELKNFVPGKAVSGIREISKDIKYLYSYCDLTDVDNMLLMQSGSLSRRLEILNTRALIKDCGLNLSITYKNRKPLVENGFISISHSDSLVAFVWNLDFEITIDIEEIGERIKRISKRAFSENELNFANNELIKLNLLWNVKESVYKLANIKGLEFKTQINVLPFTDIENIKAELISSNKKRNFLFQGKILNNHSLVFGREILKQ
ncbi:MAG: 4'-phosphopantetheinyl transferase superfamily protein [Bacteroidales bacterium]|jgi:phosphopantetheinyl transferase (holo-ACP synthase)|nr:4'-phosphopantetheinyl transferase superfamily protein [Bacteroidales bacterium]MCK9498430.1 4'-phosphopantetheinyl transferase superfamily protein [Bacteroidales bacterium]MDY0315951.1 4'-phosphopantetheinyl transferase superfamily protein [Bacteroidales bacterium]NLB85887.1 4'-phosphopantetheinyl transferase superfamily protein [Bacteroidales bacterium]